MTNSSSETGRCLCGNVEVHVSKMRHNVCACHCASCRRWGGAPFMEVNCGADVSFTGEDSISLYDSSEWAERGFCSNCGTHLFYRLKGTGEHMLTVGLFGNTENFVFDREVFIDEKPAYYDFSNKTEAMTGAEVFAKFAPPED